MCADILPPAVVTRAIETRIGQLKAEVEHLTEVVATSGHAGSIWAAEYGVQCLTRSLNYLQDKRGELESVAGSAREHLVPEAAE